MSSDAKDVVFPILRSFCELSQQIETASHNTPDNNLSDSLVALISGLPNEFYTALDALELTNDYLLPDGDNLFRIIKEQLSNAKNFLEPRRDYFIINNIGVFANLTRDHLGEVFQDKYAPKANEYKVKLQPLADAITDHNWRVEVNMEKPREDVAYIRFRYQGDASDVLRYEVAKNALNTALNSTPSGQHNPSGVDGQKLHAGMYIFINNPKTHTHQTQIVETCRAIEEQQPDIALGR